MGTKSRCALLALALTLVNVLCAYAQLRPQVTPPPTKPAAPKPPQIVIQTSPNAQVYLDDVFKGQASSQGRLVIDDAKPGDHALRVSLGGKQNYEHKVTVIAGQVTKITAVLADLAGTVVVQTSPGAAVFLDGSVWGTADAAGRLSVPDVAPGSHELRITASGKTEYRQNISVPAGQEARIEAPLADLAGTKGEVTGAAGRTHDELVALAHKYDRDYFEFSLGRKRAQQKIGTIMIELENTDIAKNTFTVTLFADDKRIRLSDKLMNQPVYFYVQGASSADELVVYKLGKDSIAGYISTPKGLFSSTPSVPIVQPGQGEGGGFGGGAYSVGGGVIAPIPTYKPEPGYSDTARKAKYQGTVVLMIVVDAQGNVTDIRVAKALGLGLDEKAVETVRTWKFKPGTRNGVPVPVRVFVEVNFRLGPS